jgi:hypothetical protein
LEEAPGENVAGAGEPSIDGELSDVGNAARQLLPLLSSVPGTSVGEISMRRSTRAGCSAR